jgi:hypothetical protein
MATVSMPQKADGMEKLARGLQLAQTVYGIYSGYQENKAKKEQEESNIVSPAGKAELLSKGFVPSETAAPDTVAFNEKTPEGLKPIFFKLPAKEQKQPETKVYEYKDASGRTRAGKTVNGEVMISAQDKVVAYPEKKEPKEQMVSEYGIPSIKGAEEKKRFDLITMGYNGVNEMTKALQDGDWTISVIGDNNYTQALRNTAEAFGRLQSGGAINKEEEARFVAMAPKMFDSPEMKAKKLNDMKNEYLRRASGFGVKEEQLDNYIAGTKSAKTLTVSPEAPSGTAMAAPNEKPMPQTVMQNGVMYRLNPKTRSYE